AVRTRSRLGHTSDIKNLPDELAAFRPTVVLSVPRVFEKVYNTAQHKAITEGHGGIFARAEATAIAYSEAMDKRGPGPVLRLRHAVYDRLVYQKLRAALGGNVQYALSGGAPLGVRLGHFFRGMGIAILEGYGLTETCAGITISGPGAQRVGAVGRAAPAHAVRISPDGEVLLKGPGVFSGYWNNEAATRQVFDEEGWFHTGDIGRLTDDGFLEITGRIKDLIVTSAGKNVAPAPLEDRMRAHWLVSQCLVVGDGRPFVAALVTLDPDALAQWAQEHHRSSTDAASLRGDPELLAELQTAVDDANEAVSKAEAIRKIRVLPADFSESGGELTPTLKVKRANVMKEFADEVDALYTK
ncbi:MAG TPA: AMP-dependent synthetase/ligase, partial [Candidatus Eisenbacteria bacterium]|nr:AMP-dependent synthetase/ligase [Candidatus Eisenbacteria bacterium]